MNTSIIIIIIIIVLAIIGGTYFYYWIWMGGGTPEPNMSKIITESQKSPKATIATSKGNITIEFYAADTPKTVANFIKLAKEKFYDGVKFHRVIKGFMIQGGDPLTKDDTEINLWGQGEPGYKFADELNPATKSFQDGYKRGVVAMANTGPNTNGSQFFIMHADYPLPHHYTIFGKVISGIEVVDAIANSPTGQNDRPITPIVIKQVTIEQ